MDVGAAHHHGGGVQEAGCMGQIPGKIGRPSQTGQTRCLWALLADQWGVECTVGTELYCIPACQGTYLAIHKACVQCQRGRVVLLKALAPVRASQLALGEGANGSELSPSPFPGSNSYVRRR